MFCVRTASEPSHKTGVAHKTFYVLGQLAHKTYRFYVLENEHIKLFLCATPVLCAGSELFFLRSHVKHKNNPTECFCVLCCHGSDSSPETQSPRKT